MIRAKRCIIRLKAKMVSNQGKLPGQIAKAMIEAKSRSIRFEHMTRGRKLFIETIEDV